MQSQSILEAKDLHKSYRGRKVIRGVSFRFESSEVVGIFGPNGSGKTTSFYMIVGLLAADEGEIFLNQSRIDSLPFYKRARQGIGYLPQESSIFRRLSVRDNIRAVLELRRDLNAKAQAQKLATLLEEFNLGRIESSLGVSLSGGERRRVEIARLLATEPSFLFLDEPFAGIDPVSVEDIQKMIQYLAHEHHMGVIITDHNIRETMKICERAYVIYDGQILTEGSPESIEKNKQVRRVYLGDQFQF